ncbi:MAG: helix-hairpin-helix domain-containing protein [Bacteroidetes bacterium]|nr:helix-hairpin-helix domain-containing protein [Bacteroidota bacterium]
MNRKIEKIVKTYFYFNNSERKSIIALIILIIIFIALPQLYFKFFSIGKLDLKITELKQNETSFFEVNNPTETQDEISLKSSISFDPNTATNNELTALGFNEKNIKTIRNYQSKGGLFKKSDDLSKLYGVDKALLEKILPLVEIKNKNKPKESQDSRLDSFYKRKKVIEVVEINSADSETLVGLYRIGPSLASKIINYRIKLGGFLNLNQLTEIWGFDEDILYDLQDKIRIDQSKAKRLNLNNVDLETLKQHPYYKFKLSQAIINYRLQHGNFKSMSDLRNIRIVNDSIFKLISVYGYVE